MIANTTEPKISSWLIPLFRLGQASLTLQTLLGLLVLATTIMTDANYYSILPMSSRGNFIHAQIDRIAAMQWLILPGALLNYCSDGPIYHNLAGSIS